MVKNNLKGSHLRLGFWDSHLGLSVPKKVVIKVDNYQDTREKENQRDDK